MRDDTPALAASIKARLFDSRTHGKDCTHRRGVSAIYTGPGEWCQQAKQQAATTAAAVMQSASLLADDAGRFCTRNAQAGYRYVDVCAGRRRDFPALSCMRERNHACRWTMDVGEGDKRGLCDGGRVGIFGTSPSSQDIFKRESMMMMMLLLMMMMMLMMMTMHFDSTVYASSPINLISSS